MAKALDIVIFGATGFTGKYAIPVVHKLSKDKNRSLKWGVAGRSEEKLKDALKFAEKEAGVALSNIPIIIADVTNEKSLVEMASKTRMVINCCGPYQLYGEPVVKACIEGGSHHVDVTAETQFMEEIQLKYHKQAQEKGVYIVSACGVCSIPTELGVAFLQKEFGGTLNSVTSYFEGWVEGGPLPGPYANFATMESFVHFIANFEKVSKIRKELYPTKLPDFKPKLRMRFLPHQTDIVEGWAVPLPDPDRSVARRTQRYFYDVERKRPIQFEEYFVWKSFAQMLIFGLLAPIFAVLSRFEFGRKLLFKYPGFFTAGFFSTGSPSLEKCRKTWFQFTFYGEGWKDPLTSPDDKYANPPDRAIVGRVKGRDPAYGASSIFLVLSAIKILTETGRLPPGGGVYPPGAALAKTSLVKELAENGISFDVLYEKSLGTSKN